MPELTIEGLKNDVMAALAEYKSKTEAALAEIKGKPVPDEVKALVDAAIRRADEVEALLKRSHSSDNGGEIKTPYELLMESDSFKANHGRPWARGSVYGSISLKSLFAHEQKTTITSAAVGSSTPGILVPERIAQIVKPAMPRLRVRDLLQRLPTSNNAVEFPKENVFTNAASPVAETSAKPESALTFTIDSAIVRTIAHWIPASRQVLADWPLLRAYIDTRLIDGLKDAEDSELLAGDGTGQHLSGLTNEATAYDAGDDVASDTYLDKLNHAIGQVEDLNYEVDGIVLNPKDWRKIQLIKTEDGGANKGMYLMGGPQGAIAPMVWNKPVATTTAMAAGTFLVGAFRGNAFVFDREDATVDISTEHSDYFVKNLVAIRAEERLTLAVLVANAFRYGSF